MGAGGQSGTGLATYIAMEAGPGPPSPPTYIAMLLHCIIKGKAKLTIKNTSKKCDRSNHQIKKTKKTKSRKPRKPNQENKQWARRVTDLTTKIASLT